MGFESFHADFPSGFRGNPPQKKQAHGEDIFGAQLFFVSSVYKNTRGLFLFMYESEQVNVFGLFMMGMVLCWLCLQGLYDL